MKYSIFLSSIFALSSSAAFARDISVRVACINGVGNQVADVTYSPLTRTLKLYVSFLDRREVVYYESAPVDLSDRSSGVSYEVSTEHSKRRLSYGRIDH